MKRISGLTPLLPTLLALAIASPAQTPPPRIFEPAQIQSVYRIVLDRDALLLESILDVIRHQCRPIKHDFDFCVPPSINKSVDRHR
jgi:hypothetical protein